MGLERPVIGARPLEKFDCRWFVSGKGNHIDYRWTVYKLFNRGDEDIIALWSNSGKDEVMEFELNPTAKLYDIKIVEYDADERQFRTEKKLETFPREIKVKPLKEFYFISVKSDQPKFEWMKNMERRMAHGEGELISQYDEIRNEIIKLKETLRNQRRSERIRALRFIPEALNQAEDAIIMGHYSKAKEKIENIQRSLENQQ